MECKMGRSSGLRSVGFISCRGKWTILPPSTDAPREHTFGFGRNCTVVVTVQPTPTVPAPYSQQTTTLMCAPTVGQLFKPHLCRWVAPVALCAPTHLTHPPDLLQQHSPTQTQHGMQAQHMPSPQRSPYIAHRAQLSILFVWLLLDSHVGAQSFQLPP